MTKHLGAGEVHERGNIYNSPSCPANQWLEITKTWRSGPSEGGHGCLAKKPQSCSWGNREQAQPHKPTLPVWHPQHSVFPLLQALTGAQRGRYVWNRLPWTRIFACFCREAFLDFALVWTFQHSLGRCQCLPTRSSQANHCLKRLLITDNEGADGFTGNHTRVSGWELRPNAPLTVQEIWSPQHF